MFVWIKVAAVLTYRLTKVLVQTCCFFCLFWKKSNIMKNSTKRKCYCFVNTWHGQSTLALVLMCSFISKVTLLMSSFE